MTQEYRPNKIYSYKEIPSSDGAITYGWVESSNIDFDLPVVISTLSKSKYVSEADAEWSRSEGLTASYLSDYRKYFEASTGDTVESFLEKWESSESSLNEIIKTDSEREDRGRFMISLAKLIRDGKKFSMYGRVYKVISKNT